MPRLRMPPLKIAIPIAMLLVFVLLVGAALVVRAVSHYSWTVEALFRGAPEQPIAFSHVTHAQKAGIDCTFCHRTVTTEPAASVPAIEQCAFCHAPGGNPSVGVGKDNPDVKKLMEAYQAGQPINWTKVHRLPDHVQFVHEVHIRAGFSCSTCHGDVPNMQRVEQVRSLRMGDCVGCHKVNNAPTDCTTCHY